MPDFLQKQPAAKSPGEQTPIAPPPPGIGSHPRRGPLPQPMMAPEEDVDIKKPQHPFFTEYYAPVFLLLVTVFVVIGFSLLNPLIIEYKRLKGSTASTATLVTDERAYLESLQRSISAAQSIPPETLEKVDEALPHDAGTAKLLPMLALIAQQNDTRLTSVSFSGGVGEPGAVVPLDINLGITITGYTTLRKFLEAIEHNIRVFDVQGISISGSTGEQSYGLHIRAYSLPLGPRP